MYSSFSFCHVCMQPMHRMDIKRAFQIFDLDSNSSLEVFKQRYYDLAAVWHPDLHMNNPRLQQLASEKMKEINSAYAAICLYLENQVIIIACHFCGGENRKRADCNIDYAACSLCGKQLQKPLPRKQRTACGNCRCAGTIGSNGRCNYCGKTIKEGEACAAASGAAQGERRPQKAGFQKRPIKKSHEKIIIGFCLFVLLSLIGYALHDKNFRKGAPSPEKKEPAMVPKPEPAMPSNPITPQPFISKPIGPSVARDDSYYRALFKTHDVKKEDAVKLQQILHTLGYEIKKPDGLIIDNTASCLKKYSMDFGYVPQDDFPNCFFRSSYFHYQISLEHRDWLDIYLTHDLEKWIREQPENHRKQINQLSLDRPNTVVQLVRRYKFEKFKPLPAHLPATGIIRKNFYDANGQLRIKTQAESNSYYIKLIDLQTRQKALSAFIRSGGTLSVSIPHGVYELKYAAGHNWYGFEYLFGTATSYARLPDSINFIGKSSPIDGLAIELIPSQYGKLTAEIISEYDF